MASIKRVPNERTRQVAKNVAAIRANLGLNLTEFGAIVDVTPPTVRNWEDEELTSEPNVSQYELLLEAQRKKESGLNVSNYSIGSILKIIKSLSLNDKHKVMIALSSEDQDK